MSYGCQYHISCLLYIVQPEGCMGSVIIVDSYWDEGYSAVVLIPVTEDYNGWHGTITFSHPVLSVTVSKASPVKK